MLPDIAAPYLPSMRHVSRRHEDLFAEENAGMQFALPYRTAAELYEAFEPGFVCRDARGFVWTACRKCGGEKTLVMSSMSQWWKCTACGSRGDLFAFCQQQRGMEWDDALRLLIGCWPASKGLLLSYAQTFYPEIFKLCENESFTLAPEGWDCFSACIRCRSDVFVYRFHLNLKGQKVCTGYCLACGKCQGLAPKSNGKHKTGALADWRYAVLDRWRGRCVVCGETEGVQAHHIVPRQADPSLQYNFGNGIALCRRHHRLAHSKKGASLNLCYGNAVFPFDAEARWAVFLDGIGAKWERVEKPAGMPSGPADSALWLPEWNLWIVVRPDTPRAADRKQARGFCEATGLAVIVPDGLPESGWQQTIFYYGSDESLAADAASKFAEPEVKQDIFRFMLDPETWRFRICIARWRRTAMFMTDNDAGFCMYGEEPLVHAGLWDPAKVAEGMDSAASIKAVEELSRHAVCFRFPPE